MMGCFHSWPPGRVVSLAGWKRIRAGAFGRLVVVWCMLLGSRTARPPLWGVVFRSRRPGPVLCGVGVWGGVVWWFENWRVDASMNGVPLWGVPGVFVLLILSNRCVPACWVGAWIVFASVLVSRPHCWCGWCLDDLISCRRVFQCRWHGPNGPLCGGWWVCCHGRMVDALAGSTDEGRVGPR